MGVRKRPVIRTLYKNHRIPACAGPDSDLGSRNNEHQLPTGAKRSLSGERQGM
jgi:hypothetical protein